MGKLASIDFVGPRPWHIELALWDIIGKDAEKLGLGIELDRDVIDE